VTDGRPPRLVVSVAELRRHLGERQEVQRSLVAEGLTVGDASVPDGGEVTFTGALESISEGVVLTGEVTTPWVGACRRCLEDVTGTAAVDVREIYEVRPTEGETWPLVNDEVDLGPLLHDIALLALPLAPLCAEDCQGPAPETFPAAVTDGGGAGDDGDEPEARRDPRWAALDDLDL
jgi:uncharacterized protein